MACYLARTKRAASLAPDRQLLLLLAQLAALIALLTTDWQRLEEFNELSSYSGTTNSSRLLLKPSAFIDKGAVGLEVYQEETSKAKFILVYTRVQRLLYLYPPYSNPGGDDFRLRQLIGRISPSLERLSSTTAKTQSLSFLRALDTPAGRQIAAPFSTQADWAIIRPSAFIDRGAVGLSYILE